MCSTIPEEHNKTIRLNNHPDDGPSNDDQEKANTKGNSPLQSTWESSNKEKTMGAIVTEVGC